MNKEDILIKFKNSTSLTVEECIEKQIPKKPDLEGDGFDDNGMIIYNTWICPNCEENMRYIMTSIIIVLVVGRE